MTIRILDGVNILILENEPLIGLDLASILRDVGCVSQIVPRVNCALTILNEERFDVAILDLFEAGVKDEPNRAALARKISVLRLPYVFLVGGHTELLEQRYSNGAPRVSKPYAATDIVSAISAAYRNRT